MELTGRQKEILDFIVAFIRERGYPPSIREIGKSFHIYPRAVFDHLKALEKKGYVRRQGTLSRSLEVLVFREQGAYGEKRRLIREVPILGRVAAGKPILAAENIEGSLPLPVEWIKGEEVFILKVKGDSMAPYILPNDEVIVRSQASVENGDVAVILLGEEATIKRFFKKGRWIELRPENEQWETLRIEEGSEEVQILGKVIGVFRRC